MGDQTVKDNHAFADLQAALLRLMASKPGDRSRMDRHYAITVTDLEKVIAYFCHYVIGGYHLDETED